MIPIKISPGFLTEIDNSKIDMDKQKKKKTRIANTLIKNKIRRPALLDLKLIRKAW